VHPIRPIIARVEDGRVLLDLRTVFPEQDEAVRATLIALSPSSPFAGISLAILYTIGHSTRTSNELLEALKAHQIQTVVDIRAFPMSRRLPEFNRESLEKSLPAAGHRLCMDESAGRISPKRLWKSPGTSLCGIQASAITPTICSPQNSRRLRVNW
jgi:sugar/nucleoside kinase (ribokinase family)